jgi:hypothetical protein
MNECNVTRCPEEGEGDWWRGIVIIITGNGGGVGRGGNKGKEAELWLNEQMKQRVRTKINEGDGQ